MPIKPINVIKADLGIEPGGRVQRFFTDTCRRYMDDYIPMDHGDLRNEVEMGKDYIKYNQPYAHAQYVGIVNRFPVRNYTTPGTGPYWDKRMVSADMDEVVKQVQEEIKKHGNR